MNPGLLLLIGVGAVALIALSKKSSASTSSLTSTPGTAWRVLSRTEAVSLIVPGPGIKDKPYAEFKGPGDPAIDAMVIKLTRVGSKAAIAVEMTGKDGVRVGLPVILYVTKVVETPFGAAYEGKVISDIYSVAGNKVAGPTMGMNFAFGPPQVIDVGEAPGTPLSGEGAWAGV